MSHYDLNKRSLWFLLLYFTLVLSFSSCMKRDENPDYNYLVSKNFSVGLCSRIIFPGPDHGVVIMPAMIVGLDFIFNLVTE